MATAASHQTVRIGRGRHASPEQGACVMELASMLAGESFSDRPRCVDPVLAAYLRALNDRLGHRDRQRLKPYAARVVGTATGRAARRRRLDACLAFAGVRSHAAARARLALLLGVLWSLRLTDGAGEYAARVAIARGRVDDAFALLETLIGDGSPIAVPDAAPAAERQLVTAG